MDTTNNWKTIWEKRGGGHLASIDRADRRAMLLELKRINGFDVAKGGIPYESLQRQYEETKEMLALPVGGSVFEVGCGAGANLWLFHLDGYRVGGLDYSEKLIGIAKDVFASEQEGMLECVCAGADELPTAIKYDAALSNSVFSYFPDFAYAKRVLTRMGEKARGNIALLDIHDEAKRDAFHECRRALDPDYDIHYAGLPKLFYPRAFFEDFAKEHGCAVEFKASDIEGYWNNDYVYHVVIRR